MRPASFGFVLQDGQDSFYKMDMSIPFPRGLSNMMKVILYSIVLALTLSACSSAPTRRAEAPPPVIQPSPESTPLRLTPPPDAKVAEVQQAIKRVFKNGAVLNTDYNPSFLTGDFNGDASQDLAVILKPVKLDVMNQQMPPWLLREPRAKSRGRTPPKIEPNDVLLASIARSAIKAQPVAIQRNDPIAALLAPSARIVAVQRALTDFGYGPLKPTGLYDTETRSAIERFEKARRRPVTGQITDQLVRDLATLTGRPLE